MDKIYEYQTKQYNYKIRDIGIFAILYLIFSIYKYVQDYTKYVYLIPIIICIYIIWEDFISLSNPKIIHITDDYISFEAFNKKHLYKWEDIKKFKIKEFSTAKKMYIRINDDTLLKGRYWINCFYMNDRDELYMWLRNKEMELNPNSIKTQTIKANEEDFIKRQELKAEKERKKQENKTKDKKDIE